MFSRLRYLSTIGKGELTLDRVRAAFGRRLTDLPHYISWRLPDRRNRANTMRLRAFYNRHQGDRCFILANGPSLAKVDLRPLANEVTIGMNRIYRMREQMGFLPTYLVTADVDIQLSVIAEELAHVDTTRFVNYNARGLFPDDPRILLVKETFHPRFSVDPRGGVWGGHSVTYVCLQLAFFMGFTTVVLLGKDHNYEQRGVPGQLVYADGTEQNHAVTGYYTKGQPWRIPDYKGEEFAYRMARTAFERAGRRVVDATEGGKLTVFEKVRLSELL